MKPHFLLTTLLRAVLVSAMLIAVTTNDAVSQETKTPVGKREVAKKANNFGIYPVPHQIKTTGGTIQASAVSISSIKADPDALDVLKKAIPVSQNSLPLVIGEKVNMEKNAEYKDLAADIPNVTGAYKIVITPKKIVVIGNEGAGTFYAVQTLTQLIKRGKGEFTLPAVTILDWPDVPFRGTVEGFYGRPWQYDDRVSQLEFYGKYKLNTYIYGPKDDPFHGFSNRWREPYPEAQGKQLGELVKIAKKNKVNLVWAVHPGRDIKWGEEDEQACIKKFEMMYELGVRSFAVFFDDIGGEGAKAEGQIGFLNKINREFIHKKPDVSPLIMCPTQYNRAWSGGDYLPKMGKELDKDIQIMWTGNSVVADIKKPDLIWINERIERPAFIWWNFPVSDYVRSMLLIGRIYGLEEGTQKDMSGFTSNPMDKPEASKIALFSISDFLWNQEAFDSETSWKEGIKRLFPGYSEAMQTLANHNSDPGPSGHGYRREESVEFAPVLNKFMDSYRKNGKITNSPELAKVRMEFKKITEAPSIIRSKSKNKNLLREINPWLVNFEALGKSGLSGLDLAASLSTGNTGDSLKALLETIDELDKIEESSKEFAEKINKETGDRWQTGIKSGSLVVKPAVDELLDLASAQFYSQISGRSANIRRPYNSSSVTNGIEKMLDDDVSSFFYCSEIQKVGDYIGLDLGGIQEIKTVNIITGRKDDDHDGIFKGQLEISRDGNKWEPLMPESTGLHVVYEGSGKKGRFVRYRATHAGVPGGKSDVWTAVRDFKVNAPPSNEALTNVEGLKKMVVSSNDKAIMLNPLLEVTPLGRNQFFGLSLPADPTVKSLTLNLDIADYDGMKLEVSKDGKTWKSVPIEKKEDKAEAPINEQIRAIKLTNTSSEEKDIKISEFKLNLPEGTMSSSSAVDGKFTTKVRTKLTSTPFSVPCNFDNANTVYVFAKGASADVMAQDLAGNWKKIGQIKTSSEASMTTISLKSIKKPIRAIGFTGSGDKELVIYEVVYR